MTMSQTAINARCTRWLADQLEHRGITDANDLAEHVTRELLAQGLAPVPRPFPLKATAPVASESARQAALDAAAEAVAQAKARRFGPPPTPGIEDLVAGADDPCPTCERTNGHLPGCPDDPATPCPWPTCSLPIGHDQDEHDDDVVYAVIHEADCPGGDCQCATGQDDDQPEPDDEEVSGAFGPDDPPF